MIRSELMESCNKRIIMIIIKMMWGFYYLDGIASRKVINN